jgi:hypothetical protein
MVRKKLAVVRKKLAVVRKELTLVRKKARQDRSCRAFTCVL